MELYRHRQIGWILIPFMLLPLLSLIVIWIAVPEEEGSTVAFSVTTGMLALIWGLFYCLNVVVTSSTINISYGIGLIRKQIPLEQVRGVVPVRNSWMAGWGIRWTGDGWMWNISGLDAVSLTLADGREFRIGTDDPQRLSSMIQQLIVPTGDKPGWTGQR